MESTVSCSMPVQIAVASAILKAFVEFAKQDWRQRKNKKRQQKHRRKRQKQREDIGKSKRKKREKRAFKREGACFTNPRNLTNQLHPLAPRDLSTEFAQNAATRIAYRQLDARNAGKSYHCNRFLFWPSNPDRQYTHPMLVTSPTNSPFLAGYRTQDSE